MRALGPTSRLREARRDVAADCAVDVNLVAEYGELLSDFSEDAHRAPGDRRLADDVRCPAGLDVVACEPRVACDRGLERNARAACVQIVTDRRLSLEDRRTARTPWS